MFILSHLILLDKNPDPYYFGLQVRWIRRKKNRKKNKIKINHFLLSNLIFFYISDPDPQNLTNNNVHCTLSLRSMSRRSACSTRLELALYSYCRERAVWSAILSVVVVYQRHLSETRKGGVSSRFKHTRIKAYIIKYVHIDITFYFLN